LQKKGWAIACMVMIIKYVTENSGILNVCDRSEFAGCHIMQEQMKK